MTDSEARQMIYLIRLARERWDQQQQATRRVHSAHAEEYECRGRWIEALSAVEAYAHTTADLDDAVRLAIRECRYEDALAHLQADEHARLACPADPRSPGGAPEGDPTRTAANLPEGSNTEDPC